MEHPPKVAHVALMQVERFGLDINVKANPVGSVQHFGEVVGVAVFPPANAGFVGVINAGHVVAGQGFTRKFLLKITPSTHPAIAEAHQAFGNFVVFAVKSLLHDVPGVFRNILFHVANSQVVNAFAGFQHVR